MESTYSKYLQSLPSHVPLPLSLSAPEQVFLFFIKYFLVIYFFSL